ncbi:lysine methyltransferase [Nitzschia inconspicua]|uniref:Lysine methyltransferase n=1 Tax=Nitzschia inconspicua TaxID=303405 RepID=A0A9K3PLE1_9STRA|nr:lysine methyltransferase [Nitzschia inconspicua]
MEVLSNSQSVVVDKEDDDNFDAVDVWLSRGEFLRKLRQLEQEDEAERLKAAEADDKGNESNDQRCSTDSCTLDYPYFLQTNSKRNIYDDYKHVNYTHVNLGLFGNATEPLVLQQDRHVGKGGLIWDAGYILADTLIQQKEWLLLGDKPQRVLELGAGTGVTGLMLAQAFSLAQVHLTDLPQLQPLLETNLAQSKLENATCGVLEWGKAAVSSEKYDVILGADVVAGIYSAPALLKTLYDQSHENTHIFLSTRDRLSGIMDDFCQQLQERFEVVEKRTPCSDNRNPTVYIVHITGKRRAQ